MTKAQTLTSVADDHAGFEPAAMMRRFEAAKRKRGNWESLWQEAYEYALPQRNGFGLSSAGSARHNNLYDATALDATEQLAASLLGNLTPPWSQWFGLKPGPDLSGKEAAALAPVLEQAAKTIQAHFDRSNFIVEMHQCYLDLIVGGTAALAIEENEPGEFSAFKFTAVPLTDIVLEEDENGFLKGSFRTLSLTLAQLRGRYPLASLPEQVMREGNKDGQMRFEVLESILPNELGGYDYKACLNNGEMKLLQSGRFADTPLVAFRWLKSPGETYGRSPVM